MYRNRHNDDDDTNKNRTTVQSAATTPELDDGSLLLDDADVVVDVDVDVDQVPAQKPHFLDIDAVPPPDFVENFEHKLRLGETADMPATGEHLKLDKKYERDGEISDYELAASGYTKKEFTQDDNTLHLVGTTTTTSPAAGTSNNAISTPATRKKPKHFLDENPIPPDYMLPHDMREHRSLDRNFERQSEYQEQQQQHRTDSPASLGPLSMSGRKHSLERMAVGGAGGSSSSSASRVSRERIKEPSYTLSRFLDSDAQGVCSPISMPSTQHRLPRGSAWTESYDSHYSSLLPAPANDAISDMDSAMGSKVECVYSLLSMLGSNDPLEMSKKFLELSRTPGSCAALRRSGCIPLLVQMMYSDGDDNVRKCSSMALHNVVHSHPDEKAGRREAKVLRLLDQIMDYCNFLKTLLQSGGEAIADDSDRHPLAAISSLMKVSFDEEHRHAMCDLGALQAIPSLVHLDHAVHGPKPEDQCCNSLRRYALMALTNLTFGDENNKALLCSQKVFMEALVAQLDSAPDDLLQVTASVLRNLSWRADNSMKAVLNEIGTVTALARAAMKNKNENTLKAILSALWNLSAHCSTNKAEFCAVDGALAFLVKMLTYEGPSKTLKIIENAGGILRNVSSHIAVRENYRKILREHNCLAILLQQLKSESLTVVSNSCGTLWNLSARCPEDQKFLWDNGAVPMLRSLIHSKHEMISEGSSSALKNLLNFRPSTQNQNQLDPIARSMGLKKLPTLNARKQKALEQELGEKSHAETCDNLDVTGSTTAAAGKERSSNFDALARRYPLVAGNSGSGGGGGNAVDAAVTAPPRTAQRLTRSAMLTKSESRDSVFSAKSDSAYENLMRSHSASATTRSKNSKLTFTSTAGHGAGYGLENDVEHNEEQPINYSVKYNENSPTKTLDDASELSDGKSGSLKKTLPTSSTYPTYQETDLDQLTDFSLRYAENQIESDADITHHQGSVVGKPQLPTALESNGMKADPNQKVTTISSTSTTKTTTADGNEIILILEDSVKCYQTEDTPYVISNAASATDLRQSKVVETSSSTVVIVESAEKSAPAPLKKYQRAPQYVSGSYTPEKPISYAEEGTPGYFSRYESLSSLDESPPDNGTSAKTVGKPLKKRQDQHKIEEGNTLNEQSSSKEMSSTVVESETVPRTPQTNLNSAQETPLMFSRHSSMDSLVEEDATHIDDKSSVVSDFSRLASGVISPSELPDSPTQSMPQSPRRNSGLVQQSAGYSAGISPVTPRSINGGCTETKRPLRSVFEDDLSTFHVENTPAQFSCATSLSNLSVIDDEASPPSQMIVVQANRNLNGSVNTDDNVENNIRHVHGISEGEEEDTGGNNDDMLLASCINIGMNRSNNMVPPNLKNSQHSGMQPRTVLPIADEPRQYFTEDTPALLSKVGSNSNLSAISICSSSNEHKDDADYKQNNQNSDANANNRRSLNLSDDVSSNASESGAIGQSYDILQECIREGMKKPGSGGLAELVPHKMSKPVMDPIAMMRRGGNILPPYLPVTDEMSKYIVEDSPCNFSVVSGLSNLTVGSSLVGPAIHLKESDEHEDKHQPDTNVASGVVAPKTPQKTINLHDHQQQWQDDSLSSLSIDSEDDTNLLSQAIAAGCNRPKSNLGFSSSNIQSSNNGATSKRSTSLSSSQPIPINSATSASSLNSVATMRSFHQRNQQLNQQNTNNNVGQNESYSSVDSSDSNDNQSKSLFELCILSGMHKTRDNGNHRKAQPHHHNHGHGRGSKPTGDGISASVATQSNPNLKISSSHSQNRHIRERERKDEKLLMECINTGIIKKIGGSGGNVAMLENKQPSRHHHSHHQHQKFEGAQHLVSGSVAVPKNVLATSAAAQAVSHQMVDTTLKNAHNIAAPDVEKNKDTSSISNNNNNNNNNSNNNTSNMIKYTSYSPNTSNNINHADITDDLASQALKQPLSQHQTPDVNPQNHVNVQQNVIGYNMEDEPCSVEHTASDESNQSFILETTVCLEHQQATAQNTTAFDKHKDPDLMLKSVERLTMEFVTSAEQLRTNSDSLSQNSKRQGSISVVGNNSNNTWNEDTCPNDVSFPSVSITAPVMASLSYDDEDDADEATEADHKEIHDFAEITPTNEEQQAPSMLGLFVDEPDIYVNITQPNSLQTETETIVDDCITQTWNTANGDANGVGNINFQVGGEVQSAAASLANKRLFLNSNSAMTNSAIIAIEARKLAEHLKHTPTQDDEQYELTFSLNSLDLDNVRPPSCMDSLNMSGFYQDITATHSQPNSMTRVAANFMPHSPQFPTKSPKFPRKSLPAAIVARRALGHLTGSAESVNSSCYLLDNIKPPSLMDELLDSMISVASIQSEVAEQDSQSMATTISVSNYETAASGNDFDDNTVTLQSCCDNIPRDEDDDRSNSAGTPLPNDNDFSSAESTPKKSPLGLKRTLTPKQKRRLAQDRFKTYTIAADMVLNENNYVGDETEADETLQIEITETINSNVRQRSSENGNAFRRRGSHDRYKTQTINFPSELLQATEIVSLNSNDDDCVSEEMSSIKAMTQRFKFITNDVAAPHTTHTHDSAEEPLDGNSFDYEQNSETESCNKQSLERISDNELEDVNENQHDTKQPRIVKPCGVAYSGEDEVVEESQIKAIRGRKKPAYVSPYSMQFQRTNATTTVSKPPSRAAFNGKRITKPNTFISTTKLAQKKKSMEVTSTTNEQQQQQQLLPNNNGLDRQGTFVKDEPSTTAIQVPIVESSSPGKRTPTTPSKLPMKRTNSNMTSPKMSNIATTRKLGTTTTRGGSLNSSTKASANMRKIPTFGNKTAAMAQRSNSNANIRITSNAARIAVLSTRVSATTPPSRSNSNLNHTAVSSTAAAAAASAKITQAQSRIASIWKRVDDVKHRQQQHQQQKYATQKTVYQAGSSDLNKQRTINAQPQQDKPKQKSCLVTNATKAAQQIHPSKASSDADPPQLIRSSTYDNIPTSAIGGGSCTTANKLVAPTITRKMLPVPVTGRK